ncbi:hypothetical protein MKW92_017861 [Papaver armeniacum]|nr:hypothetical protein MKW92_017861 [Papaver armeniacum]
MNPLLQVLTNTNILILLLVFIFSLLGLLSPNPRGNNGKTEKKPASNLELPHISFKKLSDKYGPIMFLKLGSVPTLVVSSQILKKFSYEFVDITFAPYGERLGK